MSLDLKRYMLYLRVEITKRQTGFVFMRLFVDNINYSHIIRHEKNAFVRQCIPPYIYI